jgi:hypothetical protein
MCNCFPFIKKKSKITLHNVSKKENIKNEHISNNIIFDYESLLLYGE